MEQADRVGVIHGNSVAAVHKIRSGRAGQEMKEKTMNARSFRKSLLIFLPVLIFLLGMSSVSSAAEYRLRAESFPKPMPDGSVVTMWGFSKCDVNWVCGAPSVPGPAIELLPADTTLTIYLKNNLPAPPGSPQGSLGEPVSVVIPGQTAVMTPVKFTDNKGRQRVKSFTAETPADFTTIGTYTWTNLKAGTYLYQSGTHPAVQVQMGLYGIVTKDAAAGQAYAPAGSAYDTQVTLLVSEIDPVIHGHVAGGTYGTPPPAGITSTMNYEPRYYLVNGEPFSYGASALPAGLPGQRALVRFLNAGLRDRVPLIQGLYMDIIAEDGNVLPYVKNQYSLLLPAGKTMDALVTLPATPGYIPVYDRRLGLTNNTATAGGQLAYLQVADATQFTLTASVTGPGTVVAAGAPAGISCNPDCSETYNSGATVRLVAKPAPGSALFGWTGACTGTNPECLVTMTADATVSADFALVHTITATAGPGGSITPSGAVPVRDGASQTFTISPMSTCYQIADVLVDGTSAGPITLYEFINVTTDHTIAASFSQLTYSITASATAGGSIVPSGTWTANCGSNVSFTLTPDAGHVLSGLTDNGVDVLASVANGAYTITNVTANHTVLATFTAIPDIQVSPASLSFGNVLLFRTRTLSETMTNAGAADLVVTSYEIVGTNAAMFTVTNWTGARTIAPGGTSSLSVVFRPTSRGLKAATLRILSNDPDQPVIEVPLSGYGI